MIYISDATETGSIYTTNELLELRKVSKFYYETLHKKIEIRLEKIVKYFGICDKASNS